MLLLLLAPLLARAVIPTGQLQLGNEAEPVLCAPAYFGSLLPASREQAHSLTLVAPAAGADQSGCGADTIAVHPGGSALLVDRGTCSFFQKAENAKRAGAQALIVTNTRESIYNTATPSNSPASLVHNCDNGEAWIDALAPPAWAAENDSPACAQSAACESAQCVFTGANRSTGATTGATTQHQVCCMFDVVMEMGSNATEVLDAFLPVFVTMKDAARMRASLAADRDNFNTNPHTDLHSNLHLSNLTLTAVSIFARPSPLVDPSSVIIWALGVLTAVLGSYAGASRERSALRRSGGRDFRLCATLRSIGERLARRCCCCRHGGARESEHRALNPPPAPEDTDSEAPLDLSVWHAFGFLVMSSTFLIVLFYFKVGERTSRWVSVLQGG
jgi:signal peptide peptidase-like protein 2B